MRSAILLIPMVGGALLCSAVFASAAVAEEDLHKLQGKWTVSSFEYNQAPVPEMLGAVREFTGDRYTLTPTSGQTFTGTVKIDGSQTPRHIDLLLPDRTLKGIYEVDGPMLKIAYALSGDARPTEFKSAPDSGVVLVVHKRAE